MVPILTVRPSVFFQRRARVSRLEVSAGGCAFLGFGADVAGQPPDPLITADAEGTILDWHGAAERLFGYTSAEAVGKPLTFLERPGCEGAAARMRRSIEATGRFSGRITWVRKDGVEFTFDADARAAAGPGAPERLIRIGLEGSGRDAARDDLEDGLMLLLGSSGALLGSLDVRETLPAVLNLSRRLIDAEAYAVWRFGEGLWRIECAYGLSGEFRQSTLRTSPEWSGSLQALAVPDLTREPLVASRLELLRREGIASILAVPMPIRGKAAGTITFYYRRPREFRAEEVRLASALANLAGAAIGSAELHEEQKRSRLLAEDARRRASFMAEASTLLNSSLDYETTLASVARLAVPHIADWCTVDILGEDGVLRPLALAHADPSSVEWANQLRLRYPPDPGAPGGTHAVVRTGVPELVAEVTDEMLAAAAKDEEHLRLLRQVGFTSYMCVPLIARGHALGSIAFVSAESGRKYGAADLALAEDLARRAAMAVDNARLYGKARSEREALERALQQLRENEERLTLALEAGRMGIWDWNIATNELKWTDELEHIHGFAPGTFPGDFEGFVSVMHPEDRSGFLARVRRAVEEVAHFETEFRVTWPDGSERWVMGKGEAFAGPDGKACRMIGLGLDLTERRRLEEKLRDAQKFESIGLLAGGIAHDFNNLLTGILGNASVVAEMLPAGDPAQAMLHDVVSSSERAADLTRQLLAYSGKGRFVVERLDVSAAVRGIRDLIAATIPKKARLELWLGESLPQIEADASQFQQVVMNLAINAAEAIGDEAGALAIATGWERIGEASPAGDGQADDLEAGTYVWVEVSDSGSGMDKETIARIFDPFFTTKFTGRGLGLAAVSGIVRAHGGTIRVTSTPGLGSTFRVLFRAAATAAVAAGDAGVFADLRGAGLVLVVDDEEVVRHAAEASLRRYGYDVLAAGNGAEGVALFRARAPEIAVVLLDMTMPVMGGEQALELLKQIRPEVPVIASSGYNEVEAARRFPPGLLAGFIQKPYTAAALAGKIRAALGGQAAQARFG